VEQGGFGSVVSVDYDEGCIAHMRSLCADSPLLQSKCVWGVYDMVEDRRDCELQCMNEDGGFDIVVDKGTFDAILVSRGSVAALLLAVIRLLKPGGTYLLCSIFSREVLKRLLSLDTLGLKCSVHDIPSASASPSSPSSFQASHAATVVVCSKQGDCTATLDRLLAEEKTILDSHYQNDCPFVSGEVKQTLKHRFDGLSSEGAVTLKQAYEVIFSSGLLDTVLLEYTFECFQEDWADFMVSAKGSEGEIGGVTGVSTADALAFLETMQ
jgi:hypothetical protein